ncbi:MAG: HAD hydrolase-like protein [Solirubrobacterales bacterium]|nr:HAD hydrolase-like protein [Solirubrobacterales bacterium]
MPAAAILDVDGTLVDTNYQHVVAWQRAFRDHGLAVAAWRIHRHIGMGGDKLVEAFVGVEVEGRDGDRIRAAEERFYGGLIDEVEPIAGARELVAALKGRGHTVILASSAKDEEVEHYLDLLGIRELVDDWTTSRDVEETKPAPDLVAVAMRKAGALSAVMVGDTTWDVESAGRAEVKAIGLLTGGISEAELRGAGAVDVFASPDALRERLDVTPLR